LFGFIKYNEILFFVFSAFYFTVMVVFFVLFDNFINSENNNKVSKYD